MTKVGAIEHPRLMSFVYRIESLMRRRDELDAELAQLRGCRAYIIGAEDAGIVKIGKSRDVRARLRSLQIGSAAKLSVLRVFDTDCERALHQKFAALRRHGEWFTFDPEMLTFTPEMSQ